VKVFISSTCIRREKIADSVTELHRHGFHNIELSGGSSWYPEFEDDLLRLKDELEVTYLMHNYFPPPREHFAFNLGSMDDDIFNKSVKHCQNALKLADKLDVGHFGVHAGFKMDPHISELGRFIRGKKLYDHDSCLERFVNAVNKLAEDADALGVTLLVENNPLSEVNYNGFKRQNPFLLTTYEELEEFCSVSEVPLLLDIAHLKVTCRTLDLRFDDEFNKFASSSSYWHLSDNDGTNDGHLAPDEGSLLYSLIRNAERLPETITLEIHEPAEKIKDCQDNLLKIIETK